jgi:uncharacterized protein YdiU (UPF0061 family)
MAQTPVDYTIFFRELSTVPNDIGPLKKSFYQKVDSEKIDAEWTQWLTQWKSLIDADSVDSREAISKHMKTVNPKYSLREWFLVPAYQQAAMGDYSLIRELNDVMTQPYAELSKEIEEKYYRRKSPEFFDLAGVSFLSCSS